jgi:hypothetical protein
MSKLFDNEVSENPVTILKDSIEIKIDEVERDGEVSLEPIVSYAVNRGKGTGAQKVPLSEFPEYLESLQDFRDNGFDEAQIEGYRPAGEVVRETMSLQKPTEAYETTDDNGNTVTKRRPIKDAEPNIVSFRAKTGKGSKPARIQLDQFGDVVGILEMVPQLATESRITEAWAKHRKAQEAKAAAEAKKAEEARQAQGDGDGDDE